MASPSAVLVDDRLLIEELLAGLRWGRRRPLVCTTAYWYYRACRAAVLGAGGRLSGPFDRLSEPEQARAILSLLELRDDIELPDPRSTVPVMAEVARSQPRLNLLNLEAVAAARVLGAEVWLSPLGAAGVLPRALEAEGVRWRTVEIA